MECWICFRGQVDLLSWTSGTFEMEYTNNYEAMRKLDTLIIFCHYYIRLYVFSQVAFTLNLLVRVQILSGEIC